MIDYDDPDIQVGGNWIKWETVGDNVVGTITAYAKKKRSKDDGSEVVNPIFHITKDDGSEVSMEAGQVGLKQALVGARPQIGDRVRITYTGNQKIAGKPSQMKLFTVEVSKAPATSAPAGNGQLAAAAAVLTSAGASPVAPAGGGF